MPKIQVLVTGMPMVATGNPFPTVAFTLDVERIPMGGEEITIPAQPNITAHVQTSVVGSGEFDAELTARFLRQG